MEIKRMRPYKQFAFLDKFFNYICISGLRLITFFFARIDELPILSRFESHFAKQSFFTLELPSDNLSKEVDLRDEVCLGF